MSAPRRRRRRKAGLSRRDFLTRSGASVAALGLGPMMLAGCGDGSGGRHPVDLPIDSGTNTIFRHGVASGDPLSDRVILWTRVTTASQAAVPVTLRIARDAAFSVDVQQVLAMATPQRDFTVKLDMSGLAPATTYYYQFEFAGHPSAIGRTRTLPLGGLDRLRIAVASCSSYAHGYFNAYQRIAERADLDLVLHLGDYIYEYGNGEYGAARSYEPAGEIVSLEDYRTRHGQYKLEAELQELHRQHPVICVWDDHESANDSWQGGAENHQAAVEGDWPSRKARAQQAYDEWLPIRSTDPSRIFRSFEIGNLVSLAMLDSRLFARSEPLQSSLSVPGLPLGAFTASGAFLDSSRTLLGDEQEQWLASLLRNSAAKWKLLGQQVMFGQLKLLGAPNALGLSQFLNPDQWDGYPVARNRIFDVLRGDADHAAIDNAVVLTGDIHTAWAMDLTPDPNNALVAAGGYNPLTGEGALGVEFVATSVTSPGLDELAAVQDTLRLNNPHIKYVDLSRKGYLLLDITEQRCQGEFWAVDGIQTRGGTESLQAVFQSADGDNHLSPGTVSLPKFNPPGLAP